MDFITKVIPSRIPIWIFPKGHQRIVPPENLTGRRERIDPVAIAPEGRQRNDPLANLPGRREMIDPVAIAPKGHQRNDPLAKLPGRRERIDPVAIAPKGQTCLPKGMWRFARRAPVCFKAAGD